MKSETLTRYELVSGASHMNVLLDSDVLKWGDQVSLKEMPETMWKVVAIGETIRRASINHGWNNNI